MRFIMIGGTLLDFPVSRFHHHEILSPNERFASNRQKRPVAGFTMMRESKRSLYMKKFTPTPSEMGISNLEMVKT